MKLLHRITLVERVSYLVLLALFYAIATSQAIQSFSYKWTTIADHEQYSLAMVLDGTSPKPYAYRLLVPAFINNLVSHAPKNLLEILLDRSRIVLGSTIGSLSAQIEEKVAIPYCLILIIDFLLLFLTLILLRQLTRKIFPAASSQQI